MIIKFETYKHDFSEDNFDDKFVFEYITKIIKKYFIDDSIKNCFENNPFSFVLDIKTENNFYLKNLSVEKYMKKKIIKSFRNAIYYSIVHAIWTRVAESVAQPMANTIRDSIMDRFVKRRIRMVW